MFKYYFRDRFVQSAQIAERLMHIVIAIKESARTLLVLLQYTLIAINPLLLRLICIFITVNTVKNVIFPYLWCYVSFF